MVGLSIKQQVSYEDEWCAEAYMVTDYSRLTEADFKSVMRNYAIFKRIGIIGQPGVEEDENETNY